MSSTAQTCPVEDSLGAPITIPRGSKVPAKRASAPLAKRAPNVIIVLVLWSVALLTIEELYFEHQHDAMYLVFGLVPIGLFSMTLRLLKPVERLSNKDLREEMALTHLDAPDYLASRFRPILRAELTRFGPVLLLLMIALGIDDYTRAQIYVNGYITSDFVSPKFYGSIPGILLSGLCFLLIAGSGVFALIFGFCRLLLTSCRIQNRNRNPRPLIYTSGFAWGALAIGAPWIGVGIFSMIFSRLMPPGGPPAKIVVLECSLAIFFAFGFFAVKSWNRLCRNYFEFE